MKVLTSLTGRSEASGKRAREAGMTAVSDAQLTEVESWLDVPDQQMFAWVNGSEPAPADLDTPLFRKLRTFHGTRP